MTDTNWRVILYKYIKINGVKMLKSTNILLFTAIVIGVLLVSASGQDSQKQDQEGIAEEPYQADINGSEKASTE